MSSLHTKLSCLSITSHPGMYIYIYIFYINYIYLFVYLFVLFICLSQSNLGYNSRYWSNKESFNPQGGTTGFDESETKLPSYWSTPFSKNCLGMKVGDGTPKFILMNKTADSLYSLIADGKYRPTTLGSDTWKKLIETSSLQPHCNREGFNSICITAKARIGIHANQENDCKSCDSRIAFGATGHPDGSNKCGNVASYNGVHGRRRIKAMGYILVQ